MTTALAVKWATSVNASRPHQAKRLSLIRSFARFCVACDPRTQVPPINLLGPRGDRIAPHIFSRPQIRSLMLRARALGTRLSPLRAHTYPRLQDLRHTFATRHIAAWERTAAPLAHRLLLLSRYLGHRSFHDTWWYVSTDPTALRQAADKFDRFRHGRRTFER